MKVSKRLTASGQSMIEFSIMLPFLFLFLLALFEWGQIFVKHIRISSLCREAAIAASHDCKSIGTVSSGESQQQCVDRIQEEMTLKASYVLPDFQSKGFIIVALHGDQEVSSSAASSHTSRYTSGSLDPEILNTLGTVAMCELFYDNSIETGIENLLTFAMPRLIYKTTYA